MRGTVIMTGNADEDGTEIGRETGIGIGTGTGTAIALEMRRTMAVRERK